VQGFFASKVPVVVYVSPAGAWAASAGCFITMAADVAVMAPGTSIGAAHPVSLAMGDGESKTNDVMTEKTEKIVSTYIAGIAEKRGRNVEWAKEAVLRSESLTVTNALEKHVIDLIARDVPDLLRKLDGREIDDKRLQTAGAEIQEIRMTAGESFLHLVLRPEVMFILMLVVMYGIIGEMSSPGAILPGVAGAIALILVLYMMAILPVNLAGLALIGLSALLFVADVYAPTHGVLTGGGILSFFLGALMLFNRADPTFRLSLAYIIPATIVTALFFIFVVGAGLRAQLLPTRSGKETMIGKTAPALARIDAAGGKVFIEGEYWNAVSDSAIETGQFAEILAVEGLTLKVKPKM
jgi:membrane-bound serine protease (ClpP class)